MKSNVEWALFRDPESGEEHKVTDNNCIQGFCASRDCAQCVVNEHIDFKEYKKCSDWVKAHPLEAAEGMGYEFVCRKWKDGTMEGKGKGMVTEGTSEKLPFLCQWLHVAPETIIRVDGWDWKIWYDGTLILIGGGINRLAEVQTLYKILEHPELVEMVKRELTNEEKETLEWLRKFVPEGSQVSWDEEEEWLEVKDGGGVKVVLKIVPSLFPSLKPGWTLFVDRGELVMDKEG